MQTSRVALLPAVFFVATLSCFADALSFSTDVASIHPGNFGVENIGGLTVGDLLADFSFGLDSITHSVYFAVDRVAVGAPGSAIAALSSPSGAAGANGNVFINQSGTNIVFKSGSDLGLTPGLFGDDIH